MTPAEIAARLTPAQRKALLWLPGDGTEVRSSIAHHNAMHQLRHAGCSVRRFVNATKPMVRLTPLGAAVRAIIAEEDSRNA